MRIISLFFTLLFGCCSSAETFVVGLPLLPKFNPITNQLNSANYIGLHIYFPMFKMNKVGDLDSEFFDLRETKASDTNFVSYTFCLKKGIHFSDNTPITSRDFEVSFQKFAEMYSHMVPLKNITKISDICSKVELNASTPNLFKRLTGMASTIIKTSQINRTYPVGYGPYLVESRKDSGVTLKYNLDDKPRFDRIEFKLITNPKEVGTHFFHDINQLPPSQHSSLEKSNLIKIDAPTLKVYAIVINLPSQRERKSAQCLLRNINWTDVYGLDLIKQDSFLPIQKSTNKSEVISNLQQKLSCKNIPFKVPLLVPDLYDSKKVYAALKSHNLIDKFDVVSITSSELPEWAFSGKSYVALMGFDSSGSISSLEGDFSVYFESFFTKQNRIVSKPVVKVQDNIQKSFLPKTSIKERFKLMQSSDAYLVNSAYILPLGRVNRSFTYPKNIEIVTWVDYFSGFPEINRIK